MAALPNGQPTTYKTFIYCSRINIKEKKHAHTQKHNKKGPIKTAKKSAANAIFPTTEAEAGRHAREGKPWLNIPT